MSIFKTLERLDPHALFEAGDAPIDAILLQVREELVERGVCLDPESAEGRLGRKDVAAQLGRIAGALDRAGKSIVKPWKDKAKPVDAKRKLLRDQLYAWRDAIRAPVLEWEMEYAKKIAASMGSGDYERDRAERLRKRVHDDIEAALAAHGINNTREIRELLTSGAIPHVQVIYDEEK